jgi:hypothetical protein
MFATPHSLSLAVPPATRIIICRIRRFFMMMARRPLNIALGPSHKNNVRDNNNENDRRQPKNQDHVGRQKARHSGWLRQRQVRSRQHRA